MILKSRSRSDICGHIDSFCTHEMESDCGSHADRGRRKSNDPCDYPYPTDPECFPPQPPCPPRRRRNQSPGDITEFIIKLIMLFLIAALVVAVIISTYHYGYEKGYWDGWEARGGDQVDPEFVASSEGGPCRRWMQGICQEAEDIQTANKWSRYYLKRGDAESALENWTKAVGLYRAAMDIGSGVGAQSAIYAAKRIQFQSMTCEYNSESLSRIARDYDKNPLGALIAMKQKQQALAASGYYNGKVDNRHGPESREAIRDFQGDLWFDQTGVLSAEQTVLLICGGAQIAKDVGSQNMLGIMYAGGLGVKQNTDFALDWLETAAQRGDPDAAWNLALMYGTQTVLSSVKICDAVQNEERADSYLKEAADAGHPAAKHARSKYRSDTPEKRWAKLSGDLNKPESMSRVGRGCNPNE